MSRLKQFAAGIRVLDLSRYLPGPLATLFLADMGAVVIKIEAPAGDGLMEIGARDATGRSLYYEAINASKEVLTLDLTQEPDRARFLALVDTADVVIESFRPGVMRRLGLDSATLRMRNPRLIYVSLSGYGREGPLAAAAGHDGNYLGYAGTLASNGTQEQATLIYPPLADCMGSMFGLSTILGALLARERDGLGCDVDIALADVAMPLQLFSLAELGGTGRVPRREAEPLNGGWACYRIYTTRDGKEVVLGAIESKFWQAFCGAAGHAEWTARQRDSLPQTALIAEVSTMIGSRTLAECLARFGTVDCCFSPLLDLEESVQSQYVRTRGLVRRNAASGIYEAAYPALVDGEHSSPRSPCRPSLAAKSTAGRDVLPE